MPLTNAKADFIEPMLLLPLSSLPEGDAWAYELKLDGYRAIAIKTDGPIQLRSRNDKDFTRKYPTIPRRSVLCRTRRSLTAKS